MSFGDPYNYRYELARHVAEEHYAGLDAIRRALDALPEIEPLPALPHMAYPSKLTSEGIHPDYLREAGTFEDAIRSLTRKIAAEGARLRRLLPPAPEGYDWYWEAQESQDFLDTTYRIRWVLRTPSGIRWQP